MLHHFVFSQLCAVLLALSAIVSSTFVKTNGFSFELNGQPFSFSGTNYWSIAMMDSATMNSAIQKAKSKGFPVLRVAAWNEKDLDRGKDPGSTWFQSWTGGVPTINDGPNGLGLLDATVKAAEDAGIKLVMCLTNNWQDYGGMDTYTWNVLGTAGFTHTSFYTNDKVIDSYKRYITHIINKYKDSPAIFSWELANEARCSETNCQGSSVLTSWADKISSYIKTLDSNHMVTFGGYGYMNTQTHGWDFMYDGQSGEDFAAISKLASIDYLTVHHYTDSNTNVNLDWGMQWLKDHNSAAVDANKPLVVEEIGVTRQSADKSMTDIMQSYQKYMCSKEANAIAGVMLWSTDLVGGACPINGDPYAMCEGDSFYSTMVLGFNKEMLGKSGSGGSMPQAGAAGNNASSVSSASSASSTAPLPTTTSPATDSSTTQVPANPAHNIPGLGIVNPPSTTPIASSAIATSQSAMSQGASATSTASATGAGNDQNLSATSASSVGSDQNVSPTSTSAPSSASIPTSTVPDSAQSATATDQTAAISPVEDEEDECEL